MAAKLFEGLRVADFSWVWTGPLTTKILADYGATVIKIEGRVTPDTERTMPPYKDNIPGLNRTAYFNSLNTSKISITLNLRHPKGIEIAKRLVASADVVVENFSGGTMKRMGLGYQMLKEVKPDIIMLSTCMMGQTGPYAASRGDGNRLAGLAGFVHITGWPDRRPVLIGPYTDFVAPLFNVIAILTALEYRNQTGKGQYIDMSQYENSVHFMTPPILDYVVNKRIADKTGNRHPYAAPHGVYRCRGDDRWCALAVFTNEEWIEFCNVISNPFWVKSSSFSTTLGRKQNEDELDKLVEQWTIEQKAEDVMILMQTKGISAGVVRSAEELLEYDAQLKHRHFFSQLEHPEIGKYFAPGHSFILSESSCELRSAPLLGEHSEYVLKTILNMSDEEIAELVIKGVIE